MVLHQASRGVAAIAAVGAILVLVSGCGSSSGNSPASKVSGGGYVVELKNIGPLREAFDRGGGKARLLMLLSPT